MTTIVDIIEDSQASEKQIRKIPKETLVNRYMELLREHEHTLQAQQILKSHIHHLEKRCATLETNLHRFAPGKEVVGDYKDSP